LSVPEEKDLGCPLQAGRRYTKPGVNDKVTPLFSPKAVPDEHQGLVLTQQRVEDAFLLAYILRDESTFQVVLRLQGHLQKAEQDRIEGPIGPEDLYNTEMGILHRLQDLFFLFLQARKSSSRPPGVK